MSMGPERMPRAPRVIGALYVLAMAALAGLAAWPIYRSGDFVLVTAAAAILALAVAAAATRWRWPGWITALTAAAAFLVAGVVLAVPARRGDLVQVPAALRDVLAGAVTGFKDLVTVELPVGGYRNLLVPALLVFLVGTLAALLLSWRDARAAVFGALAALAMVWFGLLFGQPAASAPLALGSVEVAAPRELIVGALSLILSLGWLAWLTGHERRQALRRTADAQGVRVTRRRTASELRRTLLAAGMVAVAVGAGAVAAPALGADRGREVLRSGIGPQVEIARAQVPLAGYRAAFADDRHDEVLFRVSVEEGPVPDRIRLAVMTAYDGELFRVLDPAAGVSDARFVRVPGALDAGAGERSVLRIDIDRLEGIWLPTFGRLAQVGFTGASAAQLEDGFYYSAASGAAVETARGGLRPGDTYVVTAVVPPAPALAAISAPGVPEASVPAPDSLVRWIAAQDAGTDGAGLAELLSRLRSRGYLSHALSMSADDPPAWADALAGYVFEPSASGHSLARIEEMFSRLLARQAQVADSGGSLVAAVGDDEQFAVAAALIARELGFPARVVLGLRLEAAAGLPACDEGACRAGDLAAWVEVQATSGEWVAADVTPQHSEPLASELLRRRDPENPTEVRPETVQEVVPPDPVRQESADDDEAEAPRADLSALWAGLRIAGAAVLALTVVLGPFLTVIGAKAWRRRARRQDPDAVARIAGGWEEYVDTAVDHGLTGPGARTRTELAAAHGRPGVATLAAGADRAVFSDLVPADAEAAEFWRIVDAERAGLAAAQPVWRRLAAAVSLKSFTRSPAPRAGVKRAGTTRSTERRMRRRGHPRGDAQAT
ncbi:transglutaminase domain-containing protein [Microbacterium sp.]|uniref:transglutaminase domain-containing protein n=1 Tax=Microbacterium sp. TaxID=51671 RepID=UPI0037C92860